jgi:hypothetical protein
LVSSWNRRAQGPEKQTGIEYKGRSLSLSASMMVPGPYYSMNLPEIGFSERSSMAVFRKSMDNRFPGTIEADRDRIQGEIIHGRLGYCSGTSYFWTEIQMSLKFDLVLSV